MSALAPKAAAAFADRRVRFGPISDVTFQFIRGRMVRQTKRQIVGAILAVPHHARLVIGAVPSSSRPSNQALLREASSSEVSA